MKGGVEIAHFVFVFCDWGQCSKMGVDNLLDFDTFLAFLVLITASEAFQVIAQPLPTLARPADLFARVSHNDGIIRNIFIDQAGCPNESIPSNGDTADNRSVSADGSAFLNQSGPYLIHFADFGTRIINIEQNNGGRCYIMNVMPNICL